MAADLRIEHLSGARLIGQGGFSAVYAATDDRFDRRVAVKLFFRYSAERDRERFERECRIMGRLSTHPNVVTVYEAGHSREGRPYLIMELVEGGSLADRVAAAGPIPWPEAVDRLVPIARALGHGHRQGILHRDVKPENILLDGDVPKLTDFGIASINGATSSTMVSASWNHSPPETFRSKRDERSDLYSLASTLHTVITGRAPFADANDQSLEPLVHRLMYQPPPTLPMGLAPPELAALLVRTMAKEPAERPQSAEELIGLLTDVRCLASGPAPAGSPQTLAAAPTASTAPPSVPLPSVALPSVSLPSPSQGGDSQRRGGRRRTRAALVAVPLVALAGGGAWYGRGLARDGSGDDAAAPSAPAVTDGGERTAEAGAGGGSADAVTVPAPPSTGPASARPPGPAQWNAGPIEASGVAGLADGRVAVGGSDGLVRLFDPADPQGSEVVLRGHSGPVWDVLALRDGRIASSSDDGTVRVWDSRNPSAGPALFQPSSLAFTRGLVELADGRLAIARLDGKVWLWDPGRPEVPPIELEGHTDSVRAVVQLPDGRVVSGGDDTTLRVWDLQRPTAEPLLLEGHADSVWSLVVVPDGRVASASEDGTIRVWDVDQPDVAPVVLDYGHTTLIRRLVVVPDGRIAAVDADSGIVFWEPRATVDPPARLDDEVEDESEIAVTMLGDGLIVTGSLSGEIRVRPVPPR